MKKVIISVVLLNVFTTMFAPLGKPSVKVQKNNLADVVAEKAALKEKKQKQALVERIEQQAKKTGRPLAPKDTLQIEQKPKKSVFQKLFP